MSKIEWEYTGYDYQVPNIQRDYLYVGDWRIKISDLEKTIPEQTDERSSKEEEEYIRKDKVLEVLESFFNPTTKLFVQSIIESLNEIK